MAKDPISCYFQVLAYGLRKEIPREVLDRWMGRRLFEAVPYAGEREETREGIRKMRSFREEYLAGRVTMEQLDQDYLKLFIGAGRPLAPPWGGYYMNDKHLLFQDEAKAVKEWMGRSGWNQCHGPGIPEDFLSYELEFLAWVLETEEKAFTEFLNCFLLPWIKEWNQLVQLHAETEFYQALGNLIQGAIMALGECTGNALRREKGCR